MARATLIVACVIAMLAITTMPAMAGAPDVVVGTERWEFAPAASTSYLAWTEPRITENAFRSNVFAREIGSDERFRVNPRGTVATTGGIDGSTLAYDRDGDIVLFDLATRTEIDVPDGVNRRRASEYSASISGTHLLFVRLQRDRNSIVLFDLSAGTSDVLYSKANTDRRFFVLFAGQVNGNHAVWGQDVRSQEDGSLLDADVRSHDIAAGTTTRLAKPAGTLQYASSVSADGTVYFGRSGFGCGLDVQLMARSPDGTDSVLYDFPRGRDFAVSNVVNNADGTTDVYFDPGRCRADPPNQDIWRIPGLSTPPGSG
jgi:hypothetical protein